MNFADAVKTCLSQFVVWRGRASRAEFWFFILFCSLVNFLAIIFDAILGSSSALFFLTTLGLLLPSLAVSIRRLHDLDRSGWWYWISLVPLVGVIVLIVFYCTRGTEGDNQFGPDPLQGGYRRVPSSANRNSRFDRDHSDLDRLERLAEMRARGVINDTEYEAQKAAILG